MERYIERDRERDRLALKGRALNIDFFFLPSSPFQISTPNVLLLRRCSSTASRTVPRCESMGFPFGNPTNKATTSNFFLVNFFPISVRRGSEYPAPKKHYMHTYIHTYIHRKILG